MKGPVDRAIRMHLWPSKTKKLARKRSGMLEMSIHRQIFRTWKNDITKATFSSKQTEFLILFEVEEM